jgi:two-component system, OmpR family, sensor histidine kinase KdpD
MNSTVDAGSTVLPRLWLRRAPAALALVGISAWLCYSVFAVNATTAGLVFLVEILLFATRWGLFEALSSAVAAVLLLNYLFLPPVGRFVIADPQNWVALFAFLITAVVASQLSATIRRQAREAVRRREEMERLYSFSRAILLTEGGLPIGAQLAIQAARIFESTGVAIYDAQNDRTHLGGLWDPGAPEELLRAAAVHGTYSRDDTKGIQVVSVSLGGKPIGSLAVSGARIPEPVLDSLSNLVAIGLERERSQEAANRAEAAKQSEQLKSTLLDSIAHEFKTPLTSIRAAASGLLEMPSATPEQRTELATIVDGEADRLGRLVTEVIQMSRIDAGKIRLERHTMEPPELVERALAGLRPALMDRMIDVRIPEGLPLVEVDPDLMALVFRNVIDNAAKYSPAGTPIELSAEERHARVIFDVADRGAGIPEKDLSKIFEKFYRADLHRGRIPGSGMGLSISRDVVRVHGGEIWAEARAGGGTIICIALPVAEGCGGEGKNTDS